MAWLVVMMNNLDLLSTVLGTHSPFTTTECFMLSSHHYRIPQTPTPLAHGTATVQQVGLALHQHVTFLYYHVARCSHCLWYVATLWWWSPLSVTPGPAWCCVSWPRRQVCPMVSSMSYMDNVKVGPLHTMFVFVLVIHWRQSWKAACVSAYNTHTDCESFVCSPLAEIVHHVTKKCQTGRFHFADISRWVGVVLWGWWLHSWRK